MISIEPATMVHAARIHLRAADAREIAAHGLDKMTALKLSLDRAIWADAYMADGEVAAILGCGMTCMVGGYHTPWLITGEPVNRHKREFLALTKARIGELRQRYPLMVNYIHAPYTESVRWAKWLGFEVSAPFLAGPYNEPFVQIVMQTPRQKEIHDGR